VSCEFSASLVQAYLDGELDALRAAEFEKHLATCAACATTLEGARSLRLLLQNTQLYDAAPAHLRRRIRSELKFPARSSALSPVPLWRWFAVAAAIVLLTSVAWYAIPRLSDAGSNTGSNGTVPVAVSSNAPRNGSNPISAAELLDAHVRSLQAGHLTDVTSTDQHTVKPWFDGKLDFIPPVHDFQSQGFPLVGGRLDVLGQRNVAALVYGRRKHFVNVFVWPTREPDTDGVHGPASRQGYQWVHWRYKGMEFCAVSDVNGEDLRDLAQLFRSTD
jgi:mycothiol system anti-sigma-R factor